MCSTHNLCGVGAWDNGQQQVGLQRPQEFVVIVLYELKRPKM